MTSQITIGIADCAVSKDRGSTIATHGLGSCIAVAVYEPSVPVGGLLHVLLPDSAIQSERAKTNPSLFADTGVPLLIERACALGADKRLMTIRLAGGARVLDERSFFNIGLKNHAAVRNALLKAGLHIQGEAVGGKSSRSVRLELATGRFWVQETAGSENQI